MTELSPQLSAALAGRYQIERQLGSGGMATVYLAEDLKHQRKVAVKVLRPELAAAIGHERVLREITATAGLRHPHILPLSDSGEADSLCAAGADRDSHPGDLVGSNWRTARWGVQESRRHGG